MGEAPTLVEVPGCRRGGPVNKQDSWEGRPLWLGCEHVDRVVLLGLAWV